MINNNIIIIIITEQVPNMVTLLNKYIMLKYWCSHAFYRGMKKGFLSAKMCPNIFLVLFDFVSRDKNLPL